MPALETLQSIKARYYLSIADKPPGWDRKCQAEIMNAVIADNFGDNARLDCGKTEAFVDALIRAYGGEP